VPRSRSAAEAFALPRLVFVHRGGTSRRLRAPDEAALAAAIDAAWPGLTRVAYWGNESLHDTIELFATASVVVGFHGAGLVNAVFAPPGALVAEITWWSNSLPKTCPDTLDAACPAFAAGQERIWRTNSGVMDLHPRLLWWTHALPLSTSVPACDTGFAKHIEIRAAGHLLRIPIVMQPRCWNEQLAKWAAEEAGVPKSHQALDAALQAMPEVTLPPGTAERIVEGLARALPQALGYDWFAQTHNQTYSPLAGEDCTLGGDLLSAWPGAGDEGGPSAAGCALLCSADASCGVYTYFGRRSRLHARCYTK